MLKQTEIKLSLCKESGIHQPIRLRKDGFTATKSVKFAESNLLSVLEAEVKLSNIIDQHNIQLQPNYAKTTRLWVKSNGVKLTMFTISTPAFDLIDFIQKSHVSEGQKT